MNCIIQIHKFASSRNNNNFDALKLAVFASLSVLYEHLEKYRQRVINELNNKRAKALLSCQRLQCMNLYKFRNCVYLQIYWTCNECKHNLFGSFDAADKYDSTIKALSWCSHNFQFSQKCCRRCIVLENRICTS